MTSAVVSVKQVPQMAGLARMGVGIGMGALSAMLLNYAFQPYSIWPLAFVALVPMQVAAHRLMPERWAGVPPAIGWGAWLMVFLTRLFGLSLQLWIFPAIALLITFINLFSEPGIRRFHVQTGYRWMVLEGGFSVAGIEMVRSFIPQVNTHAFMVQTVYTQPWLIQPISIFSMYGLSLLIALINYALAGAIIAWMDASGRGFQPPAADLRRSLRWLAGVGIVLVTWSLIGVITLTNAPKNPATVRVAAIQTGFLKPAHMDRETDTARLQVLAEQSRSAAAQGAKLMVWPELGLGFDPQVEHTSELKALALETQAYLVIGYGVKDDPRGWRNEAVVLTPEGEFLPVYAKSHGSEPGEGPIATAGAYPVYDTPFGRFGTVICNDINFTDSSRKLATQGAQLVAVPTYEVSAPGIHFEMPIQGVLRAVENRVATVKADTAYSALIADPYGRILARRDGAPEGEAFALVADVPLSDGRTLTTYLGDWMGWLCLAGTIFFMVFQNVKAKGSKKQGK